LYYSETEKPTLIFTAIAFKISRKTYSHRCQCKQMRRDFRITTAPCHLTVVHSQPAAIVVQRFFFNHTQQTEVVILHLDLC